MSVSRLGWGRGGWRGDGGSIGDVEWKVMTIASELQGQLGRQQWEPNEGKQRQATEKSLAFQTQLEESLQTSAEDSQGQVGIT